MRKKKTNTTLQVVSIPGVHGRKRANGEHKPNPDLIGANGQDTNSRSFETRFVPRYKKIPDLPAGLPEPTFSESSNKILKERYLLKGGNLEVVETVSERFWHIAYDIASGDSDFKATPKEVESKAKEFYTMMVRQEFLPNSPTIMNSGKQNGLQYSACFVLPVGDSLPEIFDSVKYAALIHQTGGGCISGDARVWSTFCGIEPIEVLVSRAISDGRKGIRQGSGVAYDVSDLKIKTVAMNPRTAEIGLKEVSHVWQFDVPADQQILVSTYQCTQVQTSLWHPFMVLRGTKLVERRADQLVKGDIILGPDKASTYWPWHEQKKVGSLAIDEDLGWLVGFTLGDGSFGYAKNLRQYRVRWFSGTNDVLKKVQAVLSKQGIKVSIQTDKRGLLSVTTLNQRFVHDLLEACGLEKFGPKDNRIRVPELITKSPLPVVKAFLAGLLDSDGYVASDGSPSYSTVSENMSQDLAALVSLLGFTPSVKSKEPYGKGKQRTYSVQICTLPQVNNLADELRSNLANSMRVLRLKSGSRKQSALPLEFRPWRDLLLSFSLVHARRNDLGAGPLHKELNYWSAHGRIDRDSILIIADKVKPFDKNISLLLRRIADSGQEVKEIMQAPVPKRFYDLSVKDWNTYAAGSSGMVMIHNTGFAFSRLRPAGSRVRTTGGVASGPVSFLRVFNAATESIKQGGTRRGANMGILRIDHPDILEFIRCKAELDDLNKPVYEQVAPLLADDSAKKYFKTLLLDKQIANFNISCAVTEKFMEALAKEADYNLIDPHSGEVVGKLNAKAVFDEIIERAWHTGDPGLIFIDRINNSPANPVPSLETIESTNPCVTGDTLISTAEGLIPMKEVVESHFEGGKRFGGNMSLIIDQRTVNPQGLGTLPGRAIKFFDNGIKDILKLTTKSGFELAGTHDHKVLTPNGWVKFEELKPGDGVMIQSGKGSFSHNYDLPFILDDGNLPKRWSKELGQVLGWLIGDGWVRTGDKNCRVGFTFGKDDQGIMRYLQDIINGWYGRDIKPVKRIRNTYHLSYHSQRLVDFFLKLGVKPVKADKKEVPESIYTAPEEAVIGFLQGLFTSDGTVGIQEINDTKYVRLTSKSRELLRGVQLLLLNLGMLSTIYNRSRNPRNNMFPYIDIYGNKKTYTTDGVLYELQISRDNIPIFINKIGFLLERHKEKVGKLLSYQSYYKSKFEDIVLSITPAGKQRVYDLTEEKSLTFITNGIISLDCGEQPLAPWDACNLGSINLGKFVLEGGSDVDWERLGQTTKMAVHFLDNVVQTNPYNLLQIYDEVHNNRRIGLGVMGFADMLFKLKVQYNSDEALVLAEKVMRFINDEGHKMSEELAKVRGSFPNWANSIYAEKKSSSFKERPKSYAYAGGKSIRNSTVTTIAPTGTISIIGDCSSGIEPVFALAYIHKAKAAGDQYRTLTIANQTFTEIAKAQGFYSDDLAKKVLEHGSVQGLDDVPKDWQKVFITAPEIDPVVHVKMQAAFQKYTDNGVSKTINLPNSATQDDVRTAYMMAYETGCDGITIYRDGSKSVQVLNVSSTLNKDKKEDPQAPVAERPMILRGRTYKITTPVGEAFITVNRDEQDQPFEVFVTVGRGGMHTMADAEAMGRLVSLSLRLARGARETDPKAVALKIVGQLKGIGGASHVGFGKNRVMSLADAIAKVLAEDLVQTPISAAEPIPLHLTVNGQDLDSPMSDVQHQTSVTADLCPECGSASFVMEEGCKKCHSCGYSMC